MSGIILLLGGIAAVVGVVVLLDYLSDRHDRKVQRHTGSSGS